MKQYAPLTFRPFTPHVSGIGRYAPWAGQRPRWNGETRITCASWQSMTIYVSDQSCCKSGFRSTLARYTRYMTGFGTTWCTYCGIHLRTVPFCCIQFRSCERQTWPCDYEIVQNLSEYTRTETLAWRDPKQARMSWHYSRCVLKQRDGEAPLALISGWQ